MPDVTFQEDSLPVHPQEAQDGRTTAFSTKYRIALGVHIRLKEGQTQHLSGHDNALTASPVEFYFVHVLRPPI